MASSALFTPVQPLRTPDLVPTWRGFFGERLRNSIYGWPEVAFDRPTLTRKVMGFTVQFIFDPDGIGRVMLDNKANYVRPGIAQRIIGPLIGNGLLSSEGEDWRKQRKIVAPTFAPGAVAGMAPAIDRAAQALMTRWPAGKTRLDVAQAATDATMAIIADTLFSSDPRLLSQTAARHIENLVMASGQARVSTILGLQDWDISPSMVRARKGRKYLRETLAALVAERGDGGGAEDFFGNLIRALHEQFPAGEARDLAVDNAVTFYVAGHETTANALAWTLYLLAAQPDLQDEARAEAVRELAAGDITTLADRVPMLRAIFDETLRLYPPAPRFDREALADDMIGDLAVKKGDLISIWPWVLHRHRSLWDHPDQFDHTRFLGERKAAQHRFQYIPFGAGPRVCVGARFAVVEALIILSRWLAARRFSLPAGFRPDPMGGVTLRPRGGMPLLVEPV